MMRTWWLALAVEIVLIAVAPQPGNAAEADNRAVTGLFDTLAPLAEDAASKSLQARRGWRDVPGNERDHRFQGDAVLCNRQLAVLLRRRGTGAEVCSPTPRGWVQRAALLPCGAQSAKRLTSIKALTVDGGTVAVEASYQTDAGRAVGLVCELGAAATFVRTEPRGETRRLRVLVASRFGVIPDFFADDIVLDAAKIPAAQALVPTENMFAQPITGCHALAISLWDGPPRDINISMAGSGEGRTIRAADIDYAPRGKIYLALLDFPGAADAALLDKLPDRKGPIAGFKPKHPVKRLDWRMPFPAQWRVDYVTEEDNPNGWLRNREMLIPYPYPVNDGKSERFRFAKPTFEWDYGGHADRQERTGNPDRYPCWVDFEGRGHVQVGGGSYAVVVYPFDRGRGTPLEALTLTDLLRQTLGMGPCRYILDADRRATQTPGIFTCGGTAMLARLEESGKKMSQHKAEAQKLISDMLVFVKAYRRRVQQYMAFKRDVLGYLDDQQSKHPEQKGFIGRMKSLLERIPARIVQDAPQVVEQLNVQYRATLDSDAPAARKLRQDLHKRYRDTGGAQDHILGGCHFAVKLLRYRAGLTLGSDPVTAAIALELRKRASAILCNPMYHEALDRNPQR